MTVGFDHLFDEMMGRQWQNSVTTSQGYPPYNVERLTGESYRITLAVAGFNEKDITVTVEDGNLTIVGKIEDKDDDDNMLYRGIAQRQFNRSFRLADYVEVEKVQLKDGMLTLDLVRKVPDAMKPKVIPFSK
jgi:molecular chaperone IbpA